MTFEDLGRLIAKMSPAQRAQEVLFVDHNDEGVVRGVSLMEATEDICEVEPDETGELAPTDNVMIPDGMPYFE